MERVLHVEDEADIREVAKVALEEVGGFSVAMVESGEQVVCKALEFAPDVILLDVMMPGMDGPATLQTLLKCPATSSIPVIFMTAKVQHHEIEQYRTMGALGVIPKPFDPMTLAKVIREMCRKAKIPKFL
jgi:CheY-like chemotaxis protein